MSHNHLGSGAPQKAKKILCPRARAQCALGYDGPGAGIPNCKGIPYSEGAKYTG